MVVQQRGVSATAHRVVDLILRIIAGLRHATGMSVVVPGGSGDTATASVGVVGVVFSDVLVVM